MNNYIQTKQDYIYLLGGMRECSVDTINKTLMDVKNLEQFMGIQPQLKQCLLQQLSKQVILNVSSMYYLQQLKQYYATYTPQTFNIFNYISKIIISKFFIELIKIHSISQIIQKIQTEFTDNTFITLLLEYYPIGEGKTISEKLDDIYIHMKTNVLITQNITSIIQLYKLLVNYIVEKLPHKQKILEYAQIMKIKKRINIQMPRMIEKLNEYEIDIQDRIPNLPLIVNTVNTTQTEMTVKDRLKFNEDEEKRHKLNTYKNKLINEYNQLIEDKKLNDHNEQELIAYIDTTKTLYNIDVNIDTFTFEMLEYEYKKIHTLNTDFDKIVHIVYNCGKLVFTQYIKTAHNDVNIIGTVNEQVVLELIKQHYIDLGFQIALNVKLYIPPKKSHVREVDIIIYNGNEIIQFIEVKSSIMNANKIIKPKKLPNEDGKDSKIEYKYSVNEQLVVKETTIDIYKKYERQKHIYIKCLTQFIIPYMAPNKISQLFYKLFAIDKYGVIITNDEMLKYLNNIQQSQHLQDTLDERMNKVIVEYNTSLDLYTKEDLEILIEMDNVYFF
jgi:hypothetical protein